MTTKAFIRKIQCLLACCIFSVSSVIWEASASEPIIQPPPDPNLLAQALNTYSSLNIPFDPSRPLATFEDFSVFFVSSLGHSVPSMLLFDTQSSHSVLAQYLFGSSFVFYVALSGNTSFIPISQNNQDDFLPDENLALLGVSSSSLLQAQNALCSIPCKGDQHRQACVSCTAVALLQVLRQSNNSPDVALPPKSQKTSSKNQN